MSEPLTTAPSAEPSLSHLLGALAGQTATLVRQEVSLARAEMGHKAVRAAQHVGQLLVGGAIVNVGLVVLLLGATFALSAYLPPWAAATVCALAALGLGGLLMRRGLHALARIEVLPEKAIETLKADVQWAKEQLR